MRSDARKRQTTEPTLEPGEKTVYLVTVYDDEMNVIGQFSRESNPGFLTSVTVLPVVV